MKYRYPKYKVGQLVRTPDGIGNIIDLKAFDGKNWYELAGRWYSESEISPK